MVAKLEPIALMKFIHIILNHFHHFIFACVAGSRVAASLVFFAFVFSPADELSGVQQRLANATDIMAKKSTVHVEQIN